MQHVSSLDELLHIIDASRAKFGFDYYSFGLKPLYPLNNDRIQFFNNYPDDWNQEYQSNQYAIMDPPIAHAHKSTIPLIWSPKTFETAPELQHGALNHGIEHGWSQAYRVHSGLFMFTLARPDKSLIENEVLEKTAMLSWFSQSVSEALERLLSDDLSSMPELSLTTREVEVLRWTANGKTSKEIAIILGVTESTVNFHLKNIIAKMNVSNKLSAAIKATALNLL